MTASDDGPLFSWRPPTKIVPFPLVKRGDFIARHARRMTEMRPQKAEEHLQRTVRDLGDKLVDMGCDPAIVAEQCTGVESFIRSRYNWLSTLRTGDGCA